MQFVTYGNIWLKCYINFLCIVADGKRSSNVLVNTISNFNSLLNLLKKNYLFLATYSIMSSITISLIDLCFLAAITFKSVFNSSSIVMCNFVSLIFYHFSFFLFLIFVLLCIYIIMLLTTKKHNNIYILNQIK